MTNLQTASADALESSDRYQRRRARLARTLEAKGILEPTVLRAIATVPRHCFVSPEFESRAYDDCPLPLDESQTISQPYIVAYMTEVAVKGRAVDKLLEVGTGSGYQAAIASQVVERVFTVECRDALFSGARQTLRELGYANIHMKRADGGKGWAQFAPYDAIMMTAACLDIPEALLKQLAVGGRLVAPIGEPEQIQRLTVVTRMSKGYSRRQLSDVRFVPLYRKQA